MNKYDEADLLKLIGNEGAFSFNIDIISEASDGASLSAVDMNGGQKDLYHIVLMSDILICILIYILGIC